MNVSSLLTTFECASLRNSMHEEAAANQCRFQVRGQPCSLDHMLVFGAFNHQLVAVSRAVMFVAGIW